MQRRLSLLKQWSKERFGAQKQTQVSDEFKALEAEMQLRSDGFTRLHDSSRIYMRWLSKRYVSSQKVRQHPIGHLGSAMIQHGNDFDNDVEFGRCLIALGEVQERLERIQEALVANATSCWLESLEYSLAQMSAYHEARKKLESKRLAFDAARSQLQRSKKDDPRLEEAVAAQARQYASSYREVLRMMRDISDGESDSIVDLTSFVGAQIGYHERCREALLSLRDHWPAAGSVIDDASEVNDGTEQRYRSARSLSSTVLSSHRHVPGRHDTSSESSSQS